MGYRQRSPKVGRDGGNGGNGNNGRNPCAPNHHAPFHRSHTRLTNTAETLNARYVRKRSCLGCDRVFLSNGPWNRFCPECTDKNSADSYRPYHLSPELSDVKQRYSRHDR